MALLNKEEEELTGVYTVHLVQLSGQSKNFGCFSTFEEVHSHTLPAWNDDKKGRRLPVILFIFISAFSFCTIFSNIFFFRYEWNFKKENVKSTYSDRRQNISINLCGYFFFLFSNVELGSIFLYLPFFFSSVSVWLDLNSEYLELGFGRGGPLSAASRAKRMRTSFKHHQLRTMKTYFAINHNPDAKDLKQLSQKTGLPKRVLQVSIQFPSFLFKFRRNIYI